MSLAIVATAPGVNSSGARYASVAINTVAVVARDPSPTRDIEVAHDIATAVGCDEEIRGLDITVHDACRMHSCQS